MAFVAFHYDVGAHAVALLGILLLVCLGLGLGLLRSGNRTTKDVGVGLITGAVFAAAAYLMQVNFQGITERDQKQAEARSYRASLAISGDLRGFDPGGRNLDGFTLAGKTMSYANLRGAHLRGANLAASDLFSARLDGARLQGADLFHARLEESSLAGAHLDGAQLRGADFRASNLSGVTLRGAVVDVNTCWPASLVSTAPPVASADGRTLVHHLVDAHLDPRGIDDLRRRMSATIGHVCGPADEADPTPAALASPVIRICSDGSLVVARRGVSEAQRTDTCEKRLR